MFVMLQGPLSEANCMQVVGDILDAKINRDKKFLLMINSSGGSVSAMSSVIETMRDVAGNMELITVGTGMVYSAAAKIFLMGEKRFLVPNTVFGLHYLGRELSGRFYVPEQSAIADRAERLNATFINTVFEKTKITKEILEQKCRGGYADWDLTPEEVEKYEVAEYLKPGWTDMFMDQGIELDDEQK